MTLSRVNNVSEAVLLAEDFKRKGTFNWFRGQVSNWLLTSSFIRLNPERKDDELQKVARFENWVRMTPGLEELAQNTDARLAVAQHYGLATTFVDFSTEPRVAGFFASYGQPTEGMESCIVCLNTAHLARFWADMPSRYPPPEFLALTVPNLWRLEAQFGTFLLCPYINFEDSYDLDRIVFPFTGPIDHPTVEEIYPHRKSNLELLLDQFFMNERLLEGFRKTESMRKNMTTIHVESTDYSAELIEGDGIPKDVSWDPTKLILWLTPTIEQFSNSVTNQTWRFEFDPDEDPNVVGHSIADNLLRTLQERPGLRDKLFAWSIGDNIEDKYWNNASLVHALQWLWDGLRTLPYDNEDIAIGLGNCVSLSLNRTRIASPSYDPWLDAASSTFGQAMEVEFGSADASYSRAYVAKSALLEAVREDVEPFLAVAYRHRLVGNVTGLLQAVKAPERLFNFDRLVKLFAQQIAPSQVLIRFPGDSKHRSSAIFFSPARLDKFGLP